MFFLGEGVVLFCFLSKVNTVGFTVISTSQYPEIAPCHRNFQVFPFPFIFFSRRLSSHVAGSDGRTGGVGPAKNDLYLQELCGNTQDLQVQPGCTLCFMSVFAPC